MSIKRALLYGFTIAFILVISTLLIGHLWVFIILIITASIAIAVSAAKQSAIKETNMTQTKRTGADDILN